MKKLAVLVLALAAMAAQAKDFGTYPINKDDILSIYDGDTFFIIDRTCTPVLCGKIGVRVNGIDTPEMKSKCESEHTAALAAKKELVNALGNGKKIELRHVTKEKYGRLLGDLYIDDKHFGDDLMQKGLAMKYHGEKKIGWCNN